MYIEQGSQHWNILIEEIEYAQKKSNKDVLCLKCWRVLNYQEGRLHKTTDHLHDIITSKYFSNEKLFLTLARRYNRIKEDTKGRLRIKSPFYSESPLDNFEELV